MTKSELLQDIKDARTELLAAIDGLTDDELVQPGAVGIWSIKDLLGHLIAWEAELVTALSRKLAKPYKSAPAIIDIEDYDEWNDEQYHLNVRKPLAIIVADFHGVHKHLLRAVEDLDERVLTAPGRFDWMEGEPLAYLILETAVWHEREHAKDILAWRDSR